MLKKKYLISDLIIIVLLISFGFFGNILYNNFIFKGGINIPSQCYTNLQPSKYFIQENPIEIKNNVITILNTRGNAMYTASLIGNGSMRPTLSKDSNLIIADVEKEKLFVGDIVIIFGEGEGFPLIHRIVEITDEGYITKGDNNNVRDSEVWNYSQIGGKIIGVIY